MKLLQYIWTIAISRPRFWLYLVGPYAIGVAVGYNTTNQLSYWPLLFLLFVFFTLPANLLIYGVNDLFDYETDRHNPKKKAYEKLLQPSNQDLFKRVLLMVVSPFLVLVVLQLALHQLWLALSMLVGFLFFGVFYSAPPIRAKTKPVLDSFFNILYVFPGLLGYTILSEQLPPYALLVAATCWVMAMHAFSAVPDIAADRKANIRTIATVLGSKATIAVCATLYVAASMLSYRYVGWVAALAGVVYWALMVRAYMAQSDDQLFAIYKRFPTVNMAIGMLLFFVALYSPGIS